MPSTGTRSPGAPAPGRPASAAATGTSRSRRPAPAVRGLASQRREVAGDRPRLAPHRLVEHAPEQQEEQQHDGGIEIGVVRRAAASRTSDMPSASITPSEIGTSMLMRPARSARQALAEERLARIGRRRQRDQRREPVEEVARLVGVMSVTLPDHTETDSSMMFMAAKPATARQRSSKRVSAASISSSAGRARTDGPVAELVQLATALARRRSRGRATPPRAGGWCSSAAPRRARAAPAGRARCRRCRPRSDALDGEVEARARRRGSRSGRSSRSRGTRDSWASWAACSAKPLREHDAAARAEQRAGRPALHVDHESHWPGATPSRRRRSGRRQVARGRRAVLALVGRPLERWPDRAGKRRAAAVGHVERRCAPARRRLRVDARVHRPAELGWRPDRRARCCTRSPPCRACRLHAAEGGDRRHASCSRSRRRRRRRSTSRMRSTCGRSGESRGLSELSVDWLM